MHTVLGAMRKSNFVQNCIPHCQKKVFEIAKSHVLAIGNDKHVLAIGNDKFQVHVNRNTIFNIFIGSCLNQLKTAYVVSLCKNCRTGSSEAEL